MYHISTATHSQPLSCMHRTSQSCNPGLKQIVTHGWEVHHTQSAAELHAPHITVMQSWLEQMVTHGWEVHHTQSAAQLRAQHITVVQSWVEQIVTHGWEVHHTQSAGELRAQHITVVQSWLEQIATHSWEVHCTQSAGELRAQHITVVQSWVEQVVTHGREVHECADKHKTVPDSMCKRYNSVTLEEYDAGDVDGATDGHLMNSWMLALTVSSKQQHSARYSR